MFSKSTRSNLFNSPRATNLASNENLILSDSHTQLRHFAKSKKDNLIQPFYSHHSPLTDMMNRPYNMIQNQLLSDISLNLNQSSYSTSTISNKKKMVSFDFHPHQQTPSLPSKPQLKSSLKMIPSESQSSIKFTKVSPSNKLFESSDSLLSVTSLKSGMSWLSGFANKTNKVSSKDFQLKKYQYQLESTEYKKQLYTDKIFACSMMSVAYWAEDKKFKDVKWMRLTQIFKGKTCVLYNKSLSKRSRISVGKFQTKSMIEAMNKLKHIERLIESMIQATEINEYGIYCTKLRVHGGQRVVVIDDNIPIICENNEVKPAFMTLDNTTDVVEFWPFLIQKAYAKLFNTYQSLMEPETEEDWMSTILGHKISVYDTNDQIIQEIVRQESTEASYIFIKEEEDWQYGKLQPSVSEDQPQYFIIQNESLPLHLLSLKYPKLMILNPLSNHSNKTESLKLTSPKSSFDICIYKFHLPFGSTIDISVWQKDIKYFRGVGYKYSPVRMMLVMRQPIGEGMRWVGSQYSESKVAAIRNWVEKGEYYVILMLNWHNKLFQLNIKLTSQTSVQSLTRIDSSLHDRILEQTASDIAQRFGKCKQVTDRVCIYRLIDRNLGIMMESIHNEHHRVIASVRKSYKVVGNNPGRILALTKNIENGSLSCDIPVLKCIGTMVLARNRGDVGLLDSHK